MPSRHTPIAAEEVAELFSCLADIERSEIVVREKMVETDLETLNSIFEVLEDWDKVLKADEAYKHPALRGPRP